MISDETVNNILSVWPVGVLSTYGKDRINSVPVVFAAAGDTIYSPIDAKPKSGRKLQRVVNLERDPRFTLLLQHYDDDWRALWWLCLNGEGEAVMDRDMPVDIASALQDKYEQYRWMHNVEGFGQFLCLRVRRKSVWAYSGEDALEARFA